MRKSLRPLAVIAAIATMCAAKSTHAQGRVEASAPSRDRFELKYSGGMVVPDNSFGGVVKIEFGKDNICTGLLLGLNPTRVLTAAHCTCDQLDTYKIYRKNARDPGRAILVVAPPSRFPGYTCSLPPEIQIGRDLGILRVEQLDNDKGEFPRFPPTVDDVLQQIATMHQIYQHVETKRLAGERLVGVGFGRTETGETPKKNAVAAIIPIQSYFCSAGFFAGSACASFREFVLADPGARPGGNPADSCGGDSGSPVFWLSPSRVPSGAPLDNDQLPLERVLLRSQLNTDTLSLVGITSRALDGVRHNPGTMCGGGGIYTSISHPEVIEWLRSHNVAVRTDFRAK